LAGRYAAALFDLAREGRVLDEVATDFDVLDRMLGDSADLVRLIRSPVLKRADQARAVAALMERVGTGQLTRNFVGLITRKGRLRDLPAMIRAYRALLAQHRGEITAEVTAAQPLDDQQTDALREKLRQALGAEPRLSVKVDPDLLGGLMVRVGSRMFDSSLRTRLNHIQLAMKSGDRAAPRTSGSAAGTASGVR
jgi:F-type H+-transporting ATPase subunit delta